MNKAFLEFKTNRDHKTDCVYLFEAIFSKAEISEVDCDHDVLINCLSAFHLQV